MKATEFVQIVQQYPCIYNSQTPDYARKDTTEKAWQEVAQEIDWTVTECKEKWKNIRNGFVRSLKPGPNGVPKKPYYLNDEMQFVVPYINPATNIQIDKRRKPSPAEDDEEEPGDDDFYKTEEIEIEVGPEIIRQREFQKPKTKTLKKKPMTKAVDKAFLSWLQSKKPKVDDPRKMFLLSLLPDVKNLTDKQLGVFRIKVLLLLEDVKTQSGTGLQELLEQCKNLSSSPADSQTYSPL